MSYIIHIYIYNIYDDMYVIYKYATKAIKKYLFFYIERIYMYLKNFKFTFQLIFYTFLYLYNCQIELHIIIEKYFPIIFIKSIYLKHYVYGNF